MKKLLDDLIFQTLLAEERPRLVRLCAWFTGNSDAAEDLAQETLVAAWKSRGQLVSQEKLKPWTSAIARNICLSWSRQNNRELARQSVAENADPALILEETLPDDTSLEDILDRHALASLLDRALALLPSATARMLVAHYVQGIPHAEIAAEFGLNPGAVGVRLQRGKAALRKRLSSAMQSEALPYGFAKTASLSWVETNIWCSLCGKSRLMGQHQRDASSGRFALRCPTCNPSPDTILVGLDLSIPQHARLLAGIKSFKPAYTRLKTYVANFFTQAMASNTASCPVCEGEVIVRVEHGIASKIPPYRLSVLFASCTRCDWVSNSNLTGLVMALPEVQQFWRENPRIRTLPLEEVEAQGALALVTRLQSVTGTAEITVLSRRDTFETISVLPGSRP